MATTGIASGEEHAFPTGQQGTSGGFNPADLEPRGFSLGNWILELLQRHQALVWGVLNRLFRVVYIPFAKWSFVLRMDDVREVLDHDAQFPVMWGDRMKQNTNGLNFVLGMKRDATYKKRYKELAKAFPIEDVVKLVAAQAASEARKIVDAAANNGGLLDGVEDLVIEVPSRLCESYYGIHVSAPGNDRYSRFGKCSLAVSSYTFAPSSDAKITRLATVAAAELSRDINDSIQAARLAPPGGIPNPQAPIIGRMIQEGLCDHEIHAHLFGMVLGFIPTDVLAGGNMLEVLMRYPEFLEAARDAALDDDDERLWKCLREALRFRHINLGAWRGVPEDYTLADGKRIRGGEGHRMLAVIPSGMFDARRVDRPGMFDPQRPEEDYMIFGIGQHWCLGAYIAKAQITQTFKPLLKREGLRAVDERVPTKRFNGLFPLHLPIRFDP